ncbi:MAG: DUF6048 family protein [Chitinophagaceae bacterium]|jgi:hypothetical protein
MSKFIFSLLLVCSFLSVFAQADTEDSVTQKSTIKYHQLRFNFDAAKLLNNSLVDNVKIYEAGLDYYLNNELYGVAEFGAGTSNIDYPDLKYKSSNSFVRLGVDKTLFERKKPNDWGMAFIGCRYGLGFVKRNVALYTTDDGFGGITSGSISSSDFTAHWFELTGGMRIELFKNTFAGWNVRFKFLLNQKSFGDLKPQSIAGYGAAENGTVFDYNFYLSYAIRWSSKK